MNTGINPEAALNEIDRTTRRIHRQRWWHVVAALVMTVYCGVFYTTSIAYPTTLAEFVLPGVVFVGLVLGFISLRSRTVQHSWTRVESIAIWTCIGLALPVVALDKWVLPDGLTPWALLVGILPALPWAVAAWKIARR